MEISGRFLLYLCVCPGESLPKLYHRLAARPRGEGRVTVRHPGTHQLGRLWPTQDHQRGETQGEGKASAALLQRGQVGSVRCKWCVILFPRSNTHSCVPPVEICRWQLLCVLHVCMCVFYHQVGGAASVPGSHGGADGEVRGQTPGRLQEDLSQRGRREIRQVL